MTKKANTIKLGTADYAKVSERIVLFRTECPNGLIETTPTIDGNMIMFKTRVLKDKSKPESAEATGHAIGENKGQKAFEKLESISVGRALAMLGYMASGEIASSEEMQDFNDWQENKRLDAFDRLDSSLSLEELKDNYMSLGSLMGDKEVIARKDQLKLNLTKNADNKN